MAQPEQHEGHGGQEAEEHPHNRKGAPRGQETHHHEDGQDHLDCHGQPSRMHHAPPRMLSTGPPPADYASSAAKESSAMLRARLIAVVSCR